MTQEEAKKILPVIEAFAKGKAVQIAYVDDADEDKAWEDTNEPSWHCDTYEYRIKPETKYRPFKNIEECWEEMLRHEPFGWVKATTGTGELCYGAPIEYISKSLITVGRANISFSEDDAGAATSIQNAFEQIVFMDGAPFGVEELEE